MIGILYILIFWAVGNLLSMLLDGYISGNIIGMLLLFIALQTKVIKAEQVRPVAKFLLGTMAMFFVPFGVGLLVSYEVILTNIWAILAALIVSTLLVLVCVGSIFQKLNKNNRE